MFEWLIVWMEVHFYGCKKLDNAMVRRLDGLLNVWWTSPWMAGAMVIHLWNVMISTIYFAQKNIRAHR